ncbi:MAG: hypothetical protein E7641_04645 [Ruminococcaceae bacterium]|nr:hypothetical protein [Oscillospiraceae bacterium]
MNPGNQIAESVIPVILGDGLSQNLLALRIYLRLGIASYLCSEKRSLLTLLNPAAKFYSLVSASEEDIACASLFYLAENRDYLPILITSSEESESFVKRHLPDLEPRFIITNGKEFFTIKPMTLI